LSGVRTFGCSQKVGEVERPAADDQVAVDGQPVPERLEKPRRSLGNESVAVQVAGRQERGWRNSSTGTRPPALVAAAVL
jgi:hypothetical protein